MAIYISCTPHLGFCREKSRYKFHRLASRGLPSDDNDSLASRGLSSDDSDSLASRGLSSDDSDSLASRGLSSDDSDSLASRGLSSDDSDSLASRGLSSDDSDSLATRGLSSDDKTVIEWKLWISCYITMTSHGFRRVAVRFLSHGLVRGSFKWVKRAEILIWYARNFYRTYNVSPSSGRRC